MQSIKDSSLLDIGDCEKLTPLHVAVAATSCENARLLMEGGANPNARAADGETPLHLANCKRHVRTMLRYGADPNLMKTGFDGRSRTALEVMLGRNSCPFRVLLNQEITSNENCAHDSDNYAIVYDLQSFKHSVDEANHGEMSLVAKVLKSGIPCLLEHPLLEVFLTLKYELMRSLFLVNLVIFLTFTLLLTSLTCLMTFQGENCLKYHSDFNCAGYSERNEGSAAFDVLYALTCAMLSVLIIREAVQLIHVGYKYVFDMENWIECAIVAIVVTYLAKLHGNAGG